MMIKQTEFALCVTLLISGTLYAASNDAVDALPYTETGVIDDVRLNKNEIIISDQLFEVIPYARVHANNKYPGVYVVEALKPDMIVGIKMGPGKHYRIITEVWLLDSLPSTTDE